MSTDKSDKPLNFTLNSAKSVVNSLMVGVETDIKIKEMKDQGRGPDEVFYAIFDSEAKIEDLAKIVCVVNLLVAMGKLYGLSDPTEQTEGLIQNKAFIGYMALLRHYVDSEPAKRFNALLNKVNINNDVWEFFLSENELWEETVKFKPYYEDAFFKWWLKRPLTTIFSINKTDYDMQLNQKNLTGDDLS